MVKGELCIIFVSSSSRCECVLSTEDEKSPSYDVFVSCWINVAIILVCCKLWKLLMHMATLVSHKSGFCCKLLLNYKISRVLNYVIKWVSGILMWVDLCTEKDLHSKKALLSTVKNVHKSDKVSMSHDTLWYTHHLSKTTSSSIEHKSILNFTVIPSRHTRTRIFQRTVEKCFTAILNICYYK